MWIYFYSQWITLDFFILLLLIIPRETLGETTGDESAMSSKIWIMEELISQPSSTLLQYHFEIIFLNNFVLSFTQSFKIESSFNSELHVNDLERWSVWLASSVINYIRQSTFRQNLADRSWYFISFTFFLLQRRG